MSASSCDRVVSSTDGSVGADEELPPPLDALDSLAMCTDVFAAPVGDDMQNVSNSVDVDEVESCRERRRLS